MSSLRRLCAILAAAGTISILGGLTPSVPAHAQQGPGVKTGRDCQTVRTCNFSRNGRPRGCLSSYTCRVCRTVVTRCNLAAGHTKCRQLVCTWGG